MKLKKQILSEEFQRFQKLAGITNENTGENTEIKNSYVDYDKTNDLYMINGQKAYEYLSQFDSDDVDSDDFMDSDDGWGEFEQYLEDMETMSDEEIEDAMRQEMSMYFFSEPDEI